MNRRGGDVDDGGIKDSHELTEQDDGQDQAGPYRKLAPAGTADLGITGQDVGHATSLVPFLSGYQEPSYPGTDTTWYAPQQ
jgi:hypothetical protein